MRRVANETTLKSVRCLHLLMLQGLEDDATV
jgi:hypothetical protein